MSVNYEQLAADGLEQIGFTLVSGNPGLNARAQRLYRRSHRSDSPRKPQLLLGSRRILTRQQQLGYNQRHLTSAVPRPATLPAPDRSTPCRPSTAVPALANRRAISSNLFA
jgi:hypothetical protein